MKRQRPSPLAVRTGGILAAAGIARDQPVLAGISGGMDSMVLLDALRELGQTVIVAHLDHRLRGRESAADARFVATASAPFPQVIHRREVATLAAAEKLSLEAAGRLARREMFARVARDHNTSCLLLAHHADDQAETVLWNMLRGCGLAGAAGMADASWQDFPGGTRLLVLRPLLGTRRKDLETHALSRGLVWREDASNTDPAFTRNRMRHQVMPALATASGRDAVPAIIRFAAIARDDNQLLDELAAGALAGLRRDPSSLDLPGMRALPVALGRRVLVQWLNQLLVPGPDFDTIGRALAVITGTARPARANLPGGYHLARRNKRIWLEPPPAR